MQPLVGMDAAFLSLETPTTPDARRRGRWCSTRPRAPARSSRPPPVTPRSVGSSSSACTWSPRCASGRMRVPFGLHHPVWVDDPDFELDDHLAGPACRRPGGRAELDAFVAAVMSRQLDPDRPLWEMYVVEGLEGERTALIAKVHHAILDGVSGASVLAAFLDLTPRHPRRGAARPEWNPAPLPSSAQMLRHAASSLAQQPGATLSTLQAGVEAVADLGMHNRELAGRGEQSPPGLLRRTADVVQRRRLQPQALRRHSPCRSTT